MYKIGEFSKIVNIPVRTLRYYNEMRILIPSEIDPFTGYRYYTEENIIECQFIQLLKSIDFTLEEIKLCKENLTVEALEKKGQEIKDKIEDLNTKYERLLYIKEKITREENLFMEEETENKDKILRRNENEKRNHTKTIKR